MLSINSLSLKYGAREVFHDLSLEVSPGEVVGILGQNGAGKTSLLKAILGEVKPLTGSVSLRPEARLSYLPQHGRFPRTAQIRGRDVVYLGLEGAKLGFWNRPGTAKRVDAAIEAVGAGAYADAPINLLSGGELQRLRIASAIVSEPDILLADEPLASLDIKHQGEIVEIFDELSQKGTAILLVTHELNSVERLLDKVVYIAVGRALAGPVEEVMTSESLSRLYEEEVEVVKIGGNFFVVGGLSGAQFVEEALHGHHHAGHFESPERPHNPKEAGH